EEAAGKAAEEDAEEETAGKAAEEEAAGKAAEEEAAGNAAEDEAEEEAATGITEDDDEARAWGTGPVASEAAASGKGAPAGSLGGSVWRHIAPHS
ncbi:MAG: hypothetical protein KDK70_35995, partial [Myxococcales bacterium]|nr:hypothetical protein [Myxococcales bacterium]